jgi:exodeoxyribonuclease VII small subunit
VTDHPGDDLAGDRTASPPRRDGDLAGYSYERARVELTEIVRKLETGGQTLEESLALWQRGEDLAALCQRWLDGAAARLDKAIAAREAGADGRANPTG